LSSGGSGGQGGAASSSLSFNDLTANTVHASSMFGTSNATGGTGGAGATTGVAGGAATASIALTGGNSVTAQSYARGGAAGTVNGGAGAAGGDATANSTANATGAGVSGTASAFASATGGAGTSQGGVHATATALTANGQLANVIASGSGSSGTAQSTATTAVSGPVSLVSSVAQSPVAGTGTALSRAVSTTVFGFNGASNNSYAFATANPNAGFVSSALASHSNLNAALGGATAGVFGTGVEGAFYASTASGAQEYRSSIDWTLDTTTISGNLIVGLLDSQTLGTGFTSLNFTIIENGRTVENDTFTSLSAAQAFFTNHVLDLGTFASGPTLSLGMNFDLITSAAASGFGEDFLVGATVVPCFCRGTRILTERGEVAVETLAIGDQVVTRSGAARPIKWIGRRSYARWFLRSNPELLPIIISAGALADGIPGRDLWISPHHALYLDDILVPAEHLVNGVSVLRCSEAETVSYFHIELDSHDVIYAEGAAAESFVDCDSRGMFHNAHEFARLYPDATPPRWVFCAPRVEAGEVLDGLRRCLAERFLAHAPTAARDPGLCLIVDGRTVLPDRAEGSVYRFSLFGRPNEIRIASRNAIPQEIGLSADLRRLGVSIERIVLRSKNVTIAIDPGEASLAEGFHEAEPDHRWTDGDALLPRHFHECLSGGLTVEIRAGALDCYPVSSAPDQGRQSGELIPFRPRAGRFAA
jgi:hypothetical protein